MVQNRSSQATYNANSSPHILIKQLKEMERRLNEAQEIARLGSWILNAQTREYEWSRAMFEIFSFDPAQGEPTREAFYLRLHPDDRARFASIVEETIATKASCDFHIRIVLDDGTIRWLHIRGRITQESASDGTLFMGIAQDITERKESELQLQQAKEEAERARDEANRASRAKSQFLANMSHEIRTPMNGVLGMAQLLGYTSLNAEQADYVATLQQSAESLLVVINDILDISKLEAGRIALSPESFDVEALINDIVALMQPEAMKKSISFQVLGCQHKGLSMWGDPIRLRQVLVNLISNAIKFTDKGRVSVQCDCVREYRFIRFSVIDSGIGISEEDQKQLFQTFSQIDGSHTRRYEGTGLGLAICKQLVQLMGGEIGVRSERGKGSLFWFEVPIHKPG